jgi:hypothetical protein
VEEDDPRSGRPSYERAHEPAGDVRGPAASTTAAQAVTFVAPARPGPFGSRQIDRGRRPSPQTGRLGEGKGQLDGEPGRVLHAMRRCAAHGCRLLPVVRSGLRRGRSASSRGPRAGIVTTPRSPRRLCSGWIFCREGHLPQPTEGSRGRTFSLARGWRLRHRVLGSWVAANHASSARLR